MAGTDMKSAVVKKRSIISTLMLEFVCILIAGRICPGTGSEVGKYLEIGRLFGF